MKNNRAQLLISAKDDTKGAFNSVKRSLGDVGNSLRSVNGLLGSLGVAISAAGFGALVRSSLQYADSLAKLSQKVGISVESLSTLIPAAELAGVSSEKFEAGMARLTARMLEASTGMIDAKRSFDTLGVAFQNQDGSLRGTEEILLDLADSFQSMPDNAEKTAIAVRLLGRSGAQLIPFLNGGREGVAKLTDELKDLGLEISTETAKKAEVFNDAMVMVRKAMGATGTRLIESFLPSMNAFALSMVESAKQGGGLNKTLNGLVLTIKTLVLGVSTLTTGLTIVGEAIGAVIAEVTQFFSGNKVGAASIEGAFKERVKVELEALAELRESLFDPPPLKVEIKAPEITGANASSSGSLVNQIKADAGIRLSQTKASVEAELKLLKASLKEQAQALAESLEDRLISIRDYHTQKTQVETREIDADIARQEKLLAAQKKVQAEATDVNARTRAATEIKKIETELVLLNQRRARIAQTNARAQAKAEQELADSLAAVKDELLDITGEATIADRQAAIERSYRDLKARLLAEGDTDGIALVDQLINVKAAEANLALLEDQWREVSDRMRHAEEALRIQQESGLLTERQARIQIVQLQQQSAAEMERLLPSMQQAAEAIGPDAVSRVAAWRNELARTRLVTDELAPLWNKVGESFGTALDGMLKGTHTWRSALLSVFQQISNAFTQELVIKPLQQWIAAQAKMAASSFGFGAAGAAGGDAGTSLFSFLGFAKGGFVSGPGTATSDSIPARLSAGEFVVRAAAVKQVGVDFLYALNGLSKGPQVKAQRLTFADGGLVPEITPAKSGQPSGQGVRIVNVIDPAMAADYLSSSSGEKTILNILQRNAGAVKQVLK